jgi:hypothetical protein
MITSVWMGQAYGLSFRIRGASSSATLRTRIRFGATVPAIMAVLNANAFREESSFAISHPIGWLMFLREGLSSAAEHYTSNCLKIVSFALIFVK